MSDESLKSRIQTAMTTAMKARNKPRREAIRLIMAAIKQREVDERIDLNDEQVFAILNRMVKQRRESVTQYESGGREDLADNERNEIAIIQEFLPQQLGEAEVETLVKKAIAENGATSLREMGKVMASLQKQMQGRADMSKVSARVKTLLT